MPYPPTPMGTYRPLLGRNAVLVLLVASVAWTALLVALEVDAGAPRWWWLVWLCGSLAWNAYWWGLRIATRFTVDARHLHWEVALRSGAVPLADVGSVRSLPVLTGVVVVRGAGMPWLLVLPQKGFAPFARFLAFEVPGVDVALRPWAVLPERLPGRTAWHPDPDRAPDRGRHTLGGPARVLSALAGTAREDDDEHRPRHLRPDPAGG